MDTWPYPTVGKWVGLVDVLEQMLAYIKTSIRKGVKVEHKFDDDALEVTLLKNFVGLNKDVKLLFTW